MRRVAPLVMTFLLSAAPALAQGRPDARKAEIDALLAALKQAPNETVAAAMEARVRQLWLQAGSPAATMLMNRGTRDLNNNADNDAVDDFDAVLALEPDLPDAFQRRALARFGLGDYRGALADLEATLQRDPSHFPAFESLSRIAEAQGDAKGALAAWQKALELSPQTPGGAERLKVLSRKALGDDT